MSILLEHPECPYCDHKHKDVDWLYDNGGFGSDGHEQEVECEDCEKAFWIKVCMVQKYSCEAREEDL